MKGDVDASKASIAAACKTEDFLEGAMALEMDPQHRNHVSVMCSREDVHSGGVNITPSLSVAAGATRP